MAFKVVKAFKSVNRKFNPAGPGQPPVYITAADIDPGSVFTLDDWVARGFVKDEDAPVAPAHQQFKRSFAPKADTE